MQNQQRQTAFKVRISDLLNGRYIVQQGWEPNYILANGQRISRANIIGVAVSKQSSELSGNETIVLDDGTGRIFARSFEKASFSYVRVSDVVLLIGRPREYGNEIYIVPEIIRVLDDKRWVEVRKKELELVKPPQDVMLAENTVGENDSVGKTQRIEELEEGIEDEGGEIEKNGASKAERIINLIKELDKGDGACFEEVASKYGKEDGEQIINGLLKRGDIFELRPGKLKIL